MDFHTTIYCHCLNIKPRKKYIKSEFRVCLCSYREPENMVGYLDFCIHGQFMKAKNEIARKFFSALMETIVAN